MIYIGIDPGLSGALGVWQPNEGVLVFDTPTVLVAGEKTKRKYLGAAMALLLKPYAERQDVIAVLEDVHAMPKQGVSSSFCFGEGKGRWEGILDAFSIPYELISPQRWKKEIMEGQGRDKSAARFKAMALFPTLADQLKLVKHDGRAEALLMAVYAQRLRK